MGWLRDTWEKLNPAQNDIVSSQEGNGPIQSREIVRHYTAYYEYLEVVNRGVNMIVDDTAEIPLRVGPSLNAPKDEKLIEKATSVVKGVRRSKLNLLLNKEPNPFQDISSFRRNLITDFIIDGNIFIYYDGKDLYHIPANKTTIIPDTKTFVAGYEYENTEFKPDEIIHIKENSFDSIYRGTSRLKAAKGSMSRLTRMLEFQDNFFVNGAVPGLVIKSPSTLSEKIKERMIQAWQTRYKPDGGGRRPMVLDGGMDLDSVSNINFRELDFENSIEKAEVKILKALGIPPLLLDSGNNANLRPNHRLYYLETILPIVQKINAALERYFGYEITEDITGIPALQPELRDAANYYTSLTNGGIITPNEAREKLNYAPLDDLDEIRVPQNIAGSATNPSEGGRPEGDTDGES